MGALRDRVDEAEQLLAVAQQELEFAISESPEVLAAMKARDAAKSEYDRASAAYCQAKDRTA